MKKYRALRISLFLNIFLLFQLQNALAQAGIQVTFLEDFTGIPDSLNKRWNFSGNGPTIIPTSAAGFPNNANSNVWVVNNTITPTIDNTENLHISCLAGDCGNAPGQNNLVVFNSTNSSHATNKVASMKRDFAPQVFNGNNLHLEFDWIFAKDPTNQDAGMRMIYSVNSGTDWKEINQTFFGNMNPGVQTTSIAINATNFPGFVPSAPKLRIGFRWFNKAPAKASNPLIDNGIIIDNLRVRNYPLLILNPINPTTVCTGDSATVIFQNSGFPPTETFTLQISDVNGSFATNQILGNLPRSSSKILIPIGLTGSNNYKIRIESTNLFFSNTILLNVIETPLKPFAGGDATECSGKNVPIGGGSAEPGVNYSWNDLTLGANISPTIPVTNNGNSFTKAIYILTGFRASCPARDTMVLTINPNPIIDAGAPFSICEGEQPVQLFPIPANTLPSATPSGSGIWTGNGMTGSVFNPSGLAGTQTLTYTYSQDWKNGGPTCEAKDTKIITVKPAPMVQAGDPLSFCNGIDSVLITGFTPAFPTGKWSGTGISSRGMFYPKSLSVGTYICTLSTTNAQGCTTFATRSIKTTPAPIIDAGNFNQVLCSKIGSYQMTGFTPPASADSKWTSSTISISPGGALSFDDTRAGIHKLKYTYDKDQCKVSDSVSLTLVKSPKVVFTSAKDSVCESRLPFPLTGVSPGGGRWKGPGITNNNFDPDSLSGSQVVWYIATSPEGNCVDSASKIIFVKDSPKANAGDSVQRICGNLLEYQMVGFSPTEGNFGRWSSDTILKISTLGKFKIDSSKVGRTYSLQYTFTKLGCSSSDFVSLTIASVPKIVINPKTQSVCANTPAFTLLGVTPIGGKWKGPGVDSLGTRFTPSPALVGSQQLRYVLKTNGCVDSAFRIMDVKSAPVVSAGLDDTVCASLDSLVLTEFSPANGKWTGFGVDSNGVFRPKKLNRVGNIQLTYTLKNSNGCEASDIKQVTIFALPEATSGLDTATCTSEGIKIGGPKKKNLYYNWVEPVANSISDDTISDPIITITNTKQKADTFFVKLLVKDTISKCVKRDTTRIIVYPRPKAVVAFPSPKFKCAGDTFIINAVTKQGLVYEWLRNGLSLNVPSEKDSILKTGLSGRYKLVVRNKGAFCTDSSINDSLTINKRFKPRILGNKLFCKDSTTQVRVTPVTAGFTYQWQYNGLNVSDSIGTTFTIGTTGTVRVILKTDKGCEDSSLIATIDSLPFPAIGFLNDTSICENSIATFRVPFDSLYNYRWFDSANNSIVSTRDTFKTAKPGKYYVEVYNFCRIVKDSARLIRINPLPRFNILRNGNEDTTVCKGIKVAVFGPIGYEKYQWVVNSSIVPGRQLNLSTDSTGETKLFLKVTDEFGCSDSDTARIKVIECTPIVYVPTAFSPQNDGQNETWKLSKYNVSEIKVYVYNRWGEMVYFTDKKGEDKVQEDQGWDGKFRGGVCPSGSYKYLIDYKGTQDGIEIVRRDTGTVTIIR